MYYCFQYLLVWGLDNLEDKRTKDLAYKWAQRWITSNFLAYKETQSMYEKYNAEEVGGHGGGGEYGVQLGFGWSNGVVLDFLNKYGQQMKSGSQ
jgi:alpha,alpha-trehalase